MPNYVYTTGIPAASHNPSSDQPPMQTNTNSINSLIEEDHYSFNDALGGYHKVIHQPAQGSDPASIAGLGQFYPKTINGEITAFYQSDTGTVYNVVNKSVSGTVTLDAMTPTVLLTGIIPDNCIGYLVVQNTVLFPGVSPNSFFYSFSAYSGVLDVQFNTRYLGNVPSSGVYTMFPITVVLPEILAAGGGAPGSLQLSLTRIGTVDLTNARWRYIYWPTL